MQETTERLLGDELLEWIGEKEKPLRVAPTEIVHLEARKMYEDFNFEMDNGCWYHFEFESDSVTLDDLKGSGNTKRLPAEYSAYQ